MLTPPAEHDYRTDFFYFRDMEGERMSKRRKSGTFGTLAKGIVRRIPSMTRPARDRKSLFRSNTVAVDGFPASATPSRASSQSSSRRAAAREPSIDSCIVRPAGAFDP
ncbi:MAG: hypothetical protein INR71_15820, partial [Terriglobus roseus]|nr:hypothetical protein [Terriglobus roseus]